MSGEMLTGQATPAFGETATTVAAQPNAATTQAQTDGADGGEGSPVAEKTFTQAELDDIVQKRIAKAEAKAERRVLRTLERVMPQREQQPAPQQAQDAKPTRREGETDDAYLDRLTDWKLDQRDSKAKQERAQESQKSLAKKTDAIYAEAQKVPGFDREAFDDLPLTRPMVEALVDSDQAAKLMAYMASNPDDIARIATLSEARQAAELGKLEAKLASAPTPKPSKAPNPIKPVGGASTPVTDFASASMDDYIAQRKKQGAAWSR